jgi:calcium-dependent protein kinase
MYLLLCGCYPFVGFELVNQIRFQNVTFGNRRWKKVSEEAKLLIELMLTKEPLMRFDAEKVLKHRWFKGIHKKKALDKQLVDLKSETILQMQQYKGTSQLKRAALNLLVREVEPAHIKTLYEQFHAMDLDQSGLITAKEMMAAVKKLGLQIREEEIENIMKEIDYFGNGEINYSEFLSATLEIQTVMTDEMMWRLFKNFDIDDTDYISLENLRNVFNRLGRTEITDKEIKEALSCHDILKDGRINY